VSPDLAADPSYALYLWHYVALTWFHALGALGSVVALMMSLVVAEASWHLVERRFILAN